MIYFKKKYSYFNFIHIYRIFTFIKIQKVQNQLLKT